MTEKLKTFGLLETEVDLKNYNTYKIGGIAKYMVSPNSVLDLTNLLKYLQENNVEFIILGNGSNVVLNDEYFTGVIITFKNMSAHQVNLDTATIYAEAGAPVPKVSIDSINKSLRGLEFAVGIPGTIGGSIYGNAGAYNACILDYVKEITALDENYDLVTIEHSKIKYGYRTSMFKEEKKYIIVAATLQLEYGDMKSSLELINDRRRRRQETQPLEYPSAGSVFRNPEGDFAGRLIEICDLKGHQIGGARVSEKHANFIVNVGNATSKDVYELINHVHQTVLEKTGVNLIIEQEFIGWK